MKDQIEFVSLLQLADSAFPSGAFTCSQGMETLVESGWVHDRASAETAIRDALVGPLGHIELPAVYAAHRAAVHGGWSDIERLNAWLDAFAQAREAREASRRIGRRLLASALVLCDGMLPPRPLQPVIPHEGLHQPLAFALAASLLGSSASCAATAYAWSACASLLTAAARLVPLGQQDTLRVQASLRPAIAEVAVQARAWKRIIPSGGSVPLADIARMRHERQERRLFAS